MPRTCAVIGMALMLGVVVPGSGVAQGPNVPSAAELADSVLALGSTADDDAVNGSEATGSEAAGSGTFDDPEIHRAGAVSYEIDPFAAVVPYGPGERLEYKVKAGIFNAGDAHMEVLGLDSVRGEPTYHVEMALKGGSSSAR